MGEALHTLKSARVRERAEALVFETMTYLSAVSRTHARARGAHQANAIYARLLQHKAMISGNEADGE